MDEPRQGGNYNKIQNRGLTSVMEFIVIVKKGQLKPPDAFAPVDLNRSFSCQRPIESAHARPMAAREESNSEKHGNHETSFRLVRQRDKGSVSKNAQNVKRAQLSTTHGVVTAYLKSP